MKPNIFMINSALGLEDALTAYWHYVLSVVPGLGQHFVDSICRSSGLAASSFIGAIDHPSGDSANHPDLLIQCRDWKLLFEHKVDSPLGDRQLERYLELAKPGTGDSRCSRPTESTSMTRCGGPRHSCHREESDGHRISCGRTFSRSFRALTTTWLWSSPSSLRVLASVGSPGAG